MSFDVELEENNEEFQVDLGETTIINNGSQDVLYTLSLADYNGIPVPDSSEFVLSKSYGKSAITSKGGVSCNIPTVYLNVTLYSAINKSDNLIKLVDIPFEYGTQPSVTNICDFEPLLVIPDLCKNAITAEYIKWILNDYITDYSSRLQSNSFSSSFGKTMGCKFTITLEFANEAIRDACYDTIKAALENISHFCLRHRTARTVECPYIGSKSVLSEIQEE